jgi:hypothetical protein
MKIGSVVQVRTFSEYIVKAPVDASDGYMPVAQVPVGTYVAIRTGHGTLVGLVSDVVHNVKEDYLPFLPQGKQEVFLPYASDYRSSYIAVTGIGAVADGVPAQALTFTPGIGDLAEVMGPGEIRAFHTVGGRASLSYYRRLQQSVSPGVIAGAMDLASQAMPECAPMLKALKRHAERKP